MEINNTWHSSAYAPTSDTPHDGSPSCAPQTPPCAAPAGVFADAVTGDVMGDVMGIVTGRVDTSITAAVRLDEVRITDLFPGSHAWSPPIS